MITILTPTYNRAHTLPRLFESLCEQEFSNFEWLVVDDGSHDATAELIASYQSKSPFPIRFIRKENGGKHTALNVGFKEASYEWIFIVDSDDYVTAEALSTLHTAIDKYGTDSRVGICFRKKLNTGEIIGAEVEDDAGKVVRMTPTEASHYFRGDLAYVFKRSALLKKPFPVIAGERFVPELYIWNKVSDLGEIVFFPGSIICICEYLDDGYSRNFRKNLRMNPRGFGIHYFAQISREKSWKNRMKCLIRYLQCRWYQLRKAQ